MTKRIDKPIPRHRKNDANEFIVVHHCNGQTNRPSELHEHAIRKSWIMRWTPSEHGETYNVTRLFFRDGSNMTIVQTYQQITDCMLVED